MKRDDEYLRDWLLEHEAKDDWLFVMPGMTSPSSEDEDKERYHVLLLEDLDFAKTVARGTFRLTAHAHDYIDAIRSDGIWEKTKAAVAETGGSATLELFKAVALGFAKQKLEKHTGIEL